ncbi:hypothetical protein SOASR031_05450 [Leminorella grimontii]|nr:hypothetical protein SOASR031_05450 [Leminorella grimontii]
MINLASFPLAFSALAFLLWLVAMLTLDVFIPASQDRWSAGRTVMSFFRVLILHSLAPIFFIMQVVFS